MIKTIQLQFLNYLLNSKDASIITTNNIDVKYFNSYSNEFLFIKNHLDKYGSIPDKVTFLSQFEDFELFEVDESPKYLVDELVKSYKKQQMVKAFNSVAQDLNEGDIEKAQDKFKKSYEEISTIVSIDCVDILKDTSRYNDYEERINNYSKYYISTGFKELDQILGGWDREEELATIIARPNVGKSWLITKFALAAIEQGLNIGYYSGEMSEKKVGYRLDTLIQHIANGSLTHGNKDVKNEYKNYISDLADRFSGSFKIITPKMLGDYATTSTLRAFIEKYNLDVLFIDQYSLMKDEDKGRTDTERTHNICGQLKKLQTLKKIPIIAISQLNREKPENGDDIELTQIANSDFVGQTSTTVIGISRDKKDKDLIKLHIVKSRDSDGVGRKLSYIVNFNLGNFTFVPEDIKDVKQSEENLEHKYDISQESSGEDEF